MRDFRYTIVAVALTVTFRGETLCAQESQPTPKYNYTNGIGIRAGRTSGIAFRHFMNTGNAFELIAGFWPNAVGLTALYEKNITLDLNGLKFYYGGGAHVTGETGSNYFRRHNGQSESYRYRYGENGYAAGIDGIAGLDYKISFIPLAVSFDIKPFVEVSNYGVIYVALDAGLGIKLAF